MEARHASIDEAGRARCRSRSTVTLANLIYFEKAQLPQALANRLIRLAAFQNPEFYKAQAMRLVGVGQAARHRLRRELSRSTSPCRAAASMPRRTLLRDNGIRCDLRDERYAGEPIEVGFVGTLAPRPGSGRRGDAASRCRRAVRADRLRQDGHGRGDDRPARREHPGAGASHRTAQAVAGASAGLPGRRQGRGRHHRRRQGQADRQDRHRRDAVAVAPGRGQCRWSRTTATSSWTSATTSARRRSTPS